jgi:hypothetical protein
MEQVCENWLTHIVNHTGHWGGSREPSVVGVQDIVVDGTLVGRNYNISPHGHVVVSILKEMAPIRAFSDESNLDIRAGGGMALLLKESLHQAVRYFTETHGRPDRMAPRDDTLPGQSHRGQWDRLLEGGARSLPDEMRWPLLMTAWHQKPPYNKYCPVGDEGCVTCELYGYEDPTLPRTYVGCVATAVAQVMNYYQWPLQGVGGHGYSWPGDTSCDSITPELYLEADFSDPYDWASMPDSLTAQSPQWEEDAVAGLCYEIGVAFEMDYGVCASSAYLEDARTIMPQFFDYADSMVKVRRVGHTDLEWWTLIRDEVEQGRPMLYNTRMNYLWHALVVDGWSIIDGTRYIHANYGWEYGYNGWFGDGWSGADSLHHSAVPDSDYVICNVMPETPDWGEWYVMPDETGDFPTIQDAIDESTYGWTIWLADGRFTGEGNRGIRYEGKSITIRSASGNSQNCIVDCEDAGYGFVFDSHETPRAVLEGVSVVNSWGGAVILESSPTIRNCIFASNDVGIGIVDGHALLTNCTIYGNSAEGLLFNSPWMSEISNCILWGNGTGTESDQINGLSQSSLISYNCIQGWSGVLGGTGNFGLDPEFCYPDTGNFEIHSESPCVAGNHPDGDDCGLIGACPVGCASPDGFALKQELPGLHWGEAKWGDFDGDDDLDLALCGALSGSWDGTVRTYENQAGTLVERQTLDGVYGRGSDHLAWGDYDADGDLDLAIAGIAYYDAVPDTADQIARVYENDGNGNLTWDTANVLQGLVHASVAWGDYDSDGDLDLALTGWDYGAPTGEYLVGTLYRNDPLGLLAPDTTVSLTGLVGGSGDWGDWDGDGDVDLLTTGAGGNTGTIFYKNDPVGTLTADGDHGLPGVYWSDAAFGDYDGDGDLDLALTGLTDHPESSLARIYENDGAGEFSEVFDLIEFPYASDTFTSSCAWGDYDNDGDLDIVFCGCAEDTSSGSSREYLKVCEYTGSGFVEQDFYFQGIDYGTYDGSLSWADVDRDGRLDLFVTGAGVPPHAKLYDKIGGFPNSAPSSPTDIFVGLSPSGLHFTWNAAVDSETPTSGHYYCLRIGTTPGANNILSGTYGTPLMGNVGQGTEVVVDIPAAGYHWGVRAIDSGFMVSEWSSDVVPTSVAPGGLDVVPMRFALEPNAPNPFSPETSIRYAIPTTGNVTLVVYSVTGRVVRRLVDTRQTPGEYVVKWNGRDEAGRSVASGVYFYRLEGSGFDDTRKMTLLR